MCTIRAALPFGYTRGSCLTGWASLKALMPDKRSLIEAVHVALFQEIDHMPEAVFLRNRQIGRASWRESKQINAGT